MNGNFPIPCGTGNREHQVLEFHLPANNNIERFFWSKVFLIQAYSFFSLFISIRDICGAKGQKVIIMHPVCTESICPAPTPAGFFSFFICTD
jgi:hypothetical protein